ncbi:DUF1566 domain-containing protein [Vibrio coralliilyticus]|uniref:Lcl C-terminal domain-containing protein n=1 Tax=Vibrio TaxID=662 RepID=UPI000501B773|nr:hypothetical protein IX95_05495 [Vibrio sp. B183]NOI20510.1 DUF1566 domain-containing protein [Vibrio coralliilyticus]
MNISKQSIFHIVSLLGVVYYIHNPVLLKIHRDIHPTKAIKIPPKKESTWRFRRNIQICGALSKEIVFDKASLCLKAISIESARNPQQTYLFTYPPLTSEIHKLNTVLVEKTKLTPIKYSGHSGRGRKETRVLFRNEQSPYSETSEAKLWCNMLNSLNLAGLDTWRVPTIKELYKLSRSQNHTSSSLLPNDYRYWSATKQTQSESSYYTFRFNHGGREKGQSMLYVSCIGDKRNN